MVEVKPVLRPAAATPKRGPLDFFEHLKIAASTKSPSTAGIDHGVVQLGAQYASYRLRGGNKRAMALVPVLRAVIEGYRPADSQPFATRQFGDYLDKQLDYLARCRQFSQSMKSVVALLKAEIGQLGPDAEESVVG